MDRLLDLNEQALDEATEHRSQGAAGIEGGIQGRRDDAQGDETSLHQSQVR